MSPAPDNRKPRPSSTRLADCLKRGRMVAAVAADYCAAGERGIAWQAYGLAQSQYRTATEMLILFHDLTGRERDAFQNQLAALRETLAKLYIAINDVETKRVPEEEGDASVNPEAAYREMLAAGHRLNNALRLEQEFGRLSTADTESIHTQLDGARGFVELSQRHYDKTLVRYRDTLIRSKYPCNGPLDRKTILVLEDEPAVASFLKKALELRGSEVLHAATGELAVTLCERHRGEISLLIADVILSSGAHGVDVANRVARYRPKLPVLFISGHPHAELVDHGLLDPDCRLFRMTDFLQKPFSPALLETRVRLLLNT